MAAGDTNVGSRPSNLESRLERLERAQHPTEMPPIRRFLCDGQADDDGGSLAEWVPPTNAPDGAITSMTICTCSALEGLRSCKHRDEPLAEGHFTIRIDRGDEDLDEADE